MSTEFNASRAGAGVQDFGHISCRAQGTSGADEVRGRFSFDSRCSECSVTRSDSYCSASGSDRSKLCLQIDDLGNGMYRLHRATPKQSTSFGDSVKAFFAKVGELLASIFLPSGRDRLSSCSICAAAVASSRSSTSSLSGYEFDAIDYNGGPMRLAPHQQLEIRQAILSDARLDGANALFELGQTIANDKTTASAKDVLDLATMARNSVRDYAALKSTTFEKALAECLTAPGTWSGWQKFSKGLDVPLRHLADSKTAVNRAMVDAWRDEALHANKKAIDPNDSRAAEEALDAKDLSTTLQETLEHFARNSDDTSDSVEVHTDILKLRNDAMDPTLGRYQADV